MKLILFVCMLGLAKSVVLDEQGNMIVVAGSVDLSNQAAGPAAVNGVAITNAGAAFAHDDEHNFAAAGGRAGFGANFHSESGDGTSPLYKRPDVAEHSHTFFSVATQADGSRIIPNYHFNGFVNEHSHGRETEYSQHGHGQIKFTNQVEANSDNFVGKVNNSNVDRNDGKASPLLAGVKVVQNHGHAHNHAEEQSYANQQQNNENRIVVVGSQLD